MFDFISLQTYAAKHPDSQSLLESVNNKNYYYTRTRGLFRICYPKERPPASAGKCFNANENKTSETNFPIGFRSARLS